MYHNIGLKAGFNTVSLANFEAQMKWVHNTFRTLPLTTYVEKLKNNRLSNQEIAITFDDGYFSFRELALPICQHLKLPLTLFLATDHVGGFNSWDVDGPEHSDYLPIMDWSDLKNLEGGDLVTIGAHGQSHRSFGDLGEEAGRREIEESKSVLERELGREVNLFSFPFGQKKDFTGSAIKALRETGFEAAVSTCYDLRNHRRQMFCLNRIEVTPEDDLMDFRKKCTNRFHKRYFIGKAKNLLYTLGLR